jgi:hypothetical protein
MGGAPSFPPSFSWNALICSLLSRVPNWRQARQRRKACLRALTAGNYCDCRFAS